MGTLGTRARNGRKQAPRGLAHPKAEHPAVAKLAAALRAHKEGVEQQAATAEILRAMSRSPGDAQPVFEAIVDKAHRLCDAAYSVLYRYDGNLIHFAAAKDVNEKSIAAVRGRYPQPPDRHKLVGRTVLEGKVFHTVDLARDERFPAAGKIIHRRAVVSVPLLRDGAVLGVISCGRAEAKAFTKKEIWLLKTFADQAVIAIENARLFNETKDALEQQTATAEILKVISAAPTATQPVFESIVKKCEVLFPDSRVAVWLVTDGRLAPRANTGYVPEPMPLDRESGVGACVLESRTIHLQDLRSGAEQYPRVRQLGLKHGYLSGVFAPLLREGQAIGAISVMRRPAGAFSDKEVALVTTFADQAVIAIENARLFNETHEALERQTAIADILSVISSSPTNIDPVLQAVAEAASRLCRAPDVFVRLIQGELMPAVVHVGAIPLSEETKSQRLTPRTAAGRAILECRAIHIPDTTDQAVRAKYPDSVFLNQTHHFKSLLIVPLVRERRAIGTITIRRPETGPFSPSQIKLLETFADQAVIAIENARLFNDTREALERQTATAEILKIISSSPSDVQPVFDGIANNAMRLLGGLTGAVTRRVGEELHLAAFTTRSKSGSEALKARFPAPLSDTSRQHVKAAVTKAPAYTVDTEAPEAPPVSRELGRASGYRSSLAVPMLREGEAIGTVAISRREPGPFSKHDIELLQTFADQAVIAIENARLFNETKEALEHQKTSADILRIVASSVENTDPVFAAITSAGMRLFPGERVSLSLARDGQVHYVSHSGISQERRTQVAKLFPRPLDRETVIGASIVDSCIVHVPDIAAASDKYPVSAKASGVSGWTAMLAVPLIENGTAIGCLGMSRPTPGPFSDKQIALAQTFADQAVIAIRNARLFNETKEALEHQKASADILKIVASSVENTDPVFEAITAAAMKLVPGARVSLTLLKDGQVHYLSHSGISAERRAEVAKHFPLPLDGPRSVATTTIIENRILHLPDVELAAKELGVAVSLNIARSSGFRAILSVPLAREGKAIGTIAVTREQPGAFSDKEIELVKTFADQAVIALQNARMFREIQDRNAELNQSLQFQSATGEILSSISSSVTDAQPVFEAIAHNTRRLLDTRYVAVSLLRGNQLELVAASGDEQYLALVRNAYPWSLEGDNGMLASRATRGREIVHVCPISADQEAPQKVKQLAKASGYESILLVPMLRQGVAIGLIATAREQPVPFDDKQIALIKAFADQAVIAIENARLFNETKEALERQTATADILKVISASPTDVQPVFDAVAERAAQLCNATNASVLIADGDVLRRVAAVGHGVTITADLPVRRTFVHGRAFLERRTNHVEDIVPLLDSEYPDAREPQATGGFRSMLSVPMMREGKAIGTIGVWRREVKPFSRTQIELLETFAAQAVIAIENVRLFNETKEALEQQTATSEVLGVISASPTELRPVFDAILKSAMQLCEAHLGHLNVYDGEYYRTVAQRGASAEFAKYIFERGAYKPSGRGLARATAERRAVQIADLREEPAYLERKPNTVKFVELGGARTSLYVPLLRQEEVIGAVVMYRPEVRPFTEKQSALLSLFANQAVIAIENVRLFNETKESLEQQTATSEILKVISSSTTDVQPVFDAITKCAVRLFPPCNGGILMREGDRLQLRSVEGPNVDAEVRGGLARFYPIPFDPKTSLAAQVILERRVAEGGDTEAPDALPVVRDAGRAGRFRSFTIVPLVRDGEGVGAIVLTHPEPGYKLSGKHVALLRTFADQAVIAIENVRLFNETKESLERQTATADILKVISSSPTDVQPVFDAIVQSASRLFGRRAALRLVDSGGLRRQAYSYPSGEFHGADVLPVDRDSLVGRVVLDGRATQVPDTSAPDAPPYARAHAHELDHRSIASAPLMRDRRAIGVISVSSPNPGALSDKQLSLLATFADQAVIAIENVRLFNETKDALERQTATSEVLRVISSSPSDVRPVFDIIAERAATLCEATFGVVTRFDGELVHLEAFHGASAAAAEPIRRLYPLKPGADTATARAIRDRAPAQIEDVLADPEYAQKDASQQAGFRSTLAVPLLREGQVIGGIAVARAQVGRFAEKQVALLKTFAEQAAIAIENVRLFNETKEALEQQTATSNILGVISSSPTDLTPVFDAILKSALELCEAHLGHLNLYDGEHHRTVAHRGASAEFAKYLSERGPYKPGPTLTRVAAERRPAQAHDMRQERGYLAGKTETVKLVELGRARTALHVPLVKEDKTIGVMVIYRPEVQPFTEKQVALVSLFASQAVIAIENVRLFNETKEALEQQTATAEILKVISSSPTATQPVFEAIVESAARLFAPCNAVLVMREGDVLQRKARAGPARSMDQAALAGIWPLPFDPERSMAARCIVERRIIEIPDTEAPGLPPIAKPLGKAAGYRSITNVPLLREGEGIGLIALSRPEPGFKLTEKQLALVRTFADQAVIAIENVRLFKELQERTEALTASVSKLTALGEVGRAITSTLDLETVLKSIVQRAVQLTELDGGSIYEYDERTEQFTLQAAENMEPELVEAVRKTPVRKGDGAIGRSAVSLEPIQVPDILDNSYRSGRKELLVRAGYRAILAVPLLREGHVLGALLVNRKTPGPFAPEVVELLKTFATQSAMAIQNARLYREIEQKSRELETASRHKSHFLASMSHELRTPLNAILGFNEMILDGIYGELSADLKAPLENVQLSGQHLLRLINNVLDLAKIEAGRMELALADFSVQDTVASVHSTLKPLAAEKGLEFVAQVPADIPPAHGDAGRLAQCLMNLAGNSLKFTKEGRVAIAVAQDDGVLRFSVADTGIGIPPEKIDNLFTEFKQTDATIASEYGGTGLGLSITKKFVEMHGGRIWVESEPGKGSTFHFEVPLRAAGR